MNFTPVGEIDSQLNFRPDERGPHRRDLLAKMLIWHFAWFHLKSQVFLSTRDADMVGFVCLIYHLKCQMRPSTAAFSRFFFPVYENNHSLELAHRAHPPLHCSLQHLHLCSFSTIKQTKTPSDCQI